MEQPPGAAVIQRSQYDLQPGNGQSGYGNWRFLQVHSCRAQGLDRQPQPVPVRRQRAGWLVRPLPPGRKPGAVQRIRYWRDGVRLKSSRGGATLPEGENTMLI